MCGRYVQITKTEVLEKTFNAKANFEIPKAFNASPSQKLPILTQKKPDLIQGASFGYLAPWASSRFKGLLNIKSESIFKQGNNSYSYHTMVKSAVLNQRCVIFANCFIEWGLPSKQPYVVYVRGFHHILFAGICTTWVDKATGEPVQSFGIITQQGNELMHTIGHHRQPKILLPTNYTHWLGASSFSDVSDLLTETMPATEMNAYPVDTLINSPKNNDKKVLDPVGERVLPEYDVKNSNELKLFGMGETQARQRKK